MVEYSPVRKVRSFQDVQDINDAVLSTIRKVDGINRFQLSARLLLSILDVDRSIAVLIRDGKITSSRSGLHAKSKR